MPRASRHFLPGYVWHITINETVSSNRSSGSMGSPWADLFSIATLRSTPNGGSKFKVQAFKERAIRSELPSLRNWPS